MTTFTTEDKEQAYKKMLEEAPAHIGYEDAIINVEPIPFAGMISTMEIKDVEYPGFRFRFTKQGENWVCSMPEWVLDQAIESAAKLNGKGTK